MPVGLFVQCELSVLITEDSLGSSCVSIKHLALFVLIYHREMKPLFDF